MAKMETAIQRIDQNLKLMKSSEHEPKKEDGSAAKKESAADNASI